MKYNRTNPCGFDDGVGDAVEKRMTKIEQACLLILKSFDLNRYLFSTTRLHCSFASLFTHLSFAFVSLVSDSVNTSLFPQQVRRRRERESFPTPLTRALLPPHVSESDL